MTKRFLAFLMCAVMIFSSMPFSPVAEFTDFALSAFAAEEGFRVTVPKITVFEKTEATLAPVATYNGVVVESGVTYRWSSSDTSVATVDENGTVKGISPGDVDITVVASYLGIEVTYTRSIEIVRFREVDSVEPDMSANVSMLEKEEKTLRVAVLPATATVKELDWTSGDESVVKIISDGVDEENSRAYARIEAIGEGTATVTYKTTDGTNKSGSFTVTVKPLIKTLSLPPFVVMTTSSTSHIIDYKITPSNAGKQVLNWSSENSSVCTVDALGVVKPGVNKLPGTCYITAKTTDGSNKTAKTLVVISDGTKSISLDKTALNMKVGERNDLTASCELKCGIKYEDAVTWTSSNALVATVDALGIVTAVGPGSAKITATTADGTNLKAECTVSVIQPVKGVSLPENEVCWLNGTKLLTPVFNPSNASDKKVTWSSSDTDVATVTDTGLVTGKKEGVATITVKTNDGGYVAYCRVSVEIPPTSVKLSHSAVSLRVGSEDKINQLITATVEPSEAKQDVIWSSSDEKVATVDENGLVTAVAGGTAIITCTTKSGGKKAVCNVTVHEDATSVEITNPPSSNLFRGQEYLLKVKFNSETVTNRDIVWSSSNTGVIEVDRNGLIVAREVGSSVIKATYVTGEGGIITAQCTVFVDPKVNVEDVQISFYSGQKVYTKAGTPVQFYAEVTPSNASDKTVYWTLKNGGRGIATIDYYTGLLTAMKPGVVEVVATSKDRSNVIDTCYVCVLGPIEFFSSTTKIGVGNTEALRLVSDNPSDTEISWMSSDTSVATVDKNGVVKGLKAGTVTITATAPQGLYSATCKVNVVIPVTGVKINAKSLTVPKGEKRSVTATVSPATATDQSVTWSTPSQTLPIITVSTTGQIEGKRVGSTTLTVTTNDGRYTDTINVEVIQPVTDIAFEYSSITLDAGRKKTLTPQIRPISATNKNVKWSTSNKNIAAVDAKGVVTAVSAGTATITCTSADGFAKETVKVTVTQPPTGIKFNAKKVTVKIGTPRKLNPTVLPENASNKNVIFSSSDEKIAKVSADGTVTGIKKGTAKITVTTANSLYSATITVNVEKPVKKVTLNRTSITIAVGKKTTITATVTPKSASNKAVTWKSSDNDVVTVKDGKITAKAPGYAVITCTTADGGKTAECTVFVNQPVKSVKLNKSKLILDIDQKFTLKATIKPSDASNKALRWTSSNKKVAKVTSKGVIKPVSTGTATITVTTVDGGFKATCKVTVVKRVKKVTLPSAVTVFLGEKEKLDAVLTPLKPSNSDVTWKSGKKSVATVSKTGLVTAKKTGVTNITVTTDDGGLKATCKVSVKRKLKSFSLNKKKATLNTGSTFALQIKRKPTNATESIYFTSSNRNIATVSSKGVITATGRGTATITAVSERGLTAKFKITVRQPVTSMNISSKAASVYMGETLKLTANVLPVNSNNQAFTWESSNNAVAAVSGGTVTPKSLGTAVITVRSANGKTASCTVTVKQHVNSVALDKKSVSLETGKTASLKVTVSPANATEKGYSFSVSDAKVASVSSSGVVTAKAPGTATVTVRSKENNKTATCTVTVIERVQSVSLSNTAETLYVDRNGVGQTLFLVAEIFPANATNKTVVWSSSDTSVAEVSANGTVTAKKSGVALITATSDDGKKTASCAVTVLQNVSGISFEKSEVTVNRGGESVRLIATVEPADAYNKNIIWTFENEAIATVDEYGWIFGKAVGKTTVHATTVDGEFKASCLVTVNEPVTGVSLDIKEVDSLYRDETVTLTPTVYPDFIEENINKNVIWTSSDESIAVVENGTVKAVGPGEAVITVTTEDGGFTDTCKVRCFMPVEEITTESDIYFIKIGEQQKIDAVILPENASFPEVEWTVVSGGDYFTCEDGLITGLDKGNGLVRITSTDNPEVTKEIEIRIVRSVDGVRLNQTSLDEFYKGQTTVLVPTVSPSDAHNKNVSFTSSDEEVVTVSEDGTVTAVGRGTAVVTVTTEDGGYTAECVFTVIQLVEEIVFPESEYTVGVGKPVNLNAEILPVNANEQTLNWESSDISKVTVNDGVVVGLGVTETPVIITAIATDHGKVAATVKVNVVKHAEKIELTADKDMLWVGESADITAVVLPEDTTDKSVSFTSSDESIATVDADGKVTALSAGETGTAEVVITAVSACDSAVSEYTFTVKQQITDIVIPEEEIVLELGDGYTFEPVVLPENAFDKTVSYISSDENVLTVEEGRVVTVGTGTATVTLVSACGKVEKQSSIRVIVLPEGIEMESEISVERTKTYTLNAVLAPDNVTETKIRYTSSDESVATVDENGVVTAVEAGTAVIIAQSEIGEVFAECTVTVYVNSEKIELTETGYELYIGEEFTLGAKVLPEDTTNKNISFASSDENILTVDKNGKVKALSKGTATVTVTAEDTGITAVCEVKVKKHAEGITVSEEAMVYVGRTVKIKADVTPADADNKNIIWKVSDSRMASVDSDGVLTAYAKGFVIVTAEAEDGGFKGVCFVEIRTGIDSVSLNKELLLLDRGASEKLTFSVLPANADEKKVIWTSSDETIATVDSKGNVTATQKSGTAKIRATAIDNPEAYAECTVTVKVPLETIYLQEKSIFLRKGESTRLEIVFRPENATVKDLTFESEDSEVVSVDKDGLITAHKNGDINVIVTSAEGGYTAVCRVKVYQEIENIVSLPLVLSRGSEAYCRVAAEPENHDETLIFTIDNENIATVDEYGLVKAKAPGTANIIVKGSISGKTHTFTVTVKEPVTEVRFDKESESVEKSGITVVEYTILPLDADNIESVEITSSDSQIAKIIYKSDGTTDGSVQGLQVGEAVITVKVTTTDSEVFTDSYTLTVTEIE